MRSVTGRSYTFKTRPGKTRRPGDDRVSNLHIEIRGLTETGTREKGGVKGVTGGVTPFRRAGGMPEKLKLADRIRVGLISAD